MNAVKRTRRCSKCRRVKPTTEYHKHKNGKDGLRSRCKTCNRAEAREFYKRKPESYKARARRSHAVKLKERKTYLLGLKQKLGCQTCNEREVVTLDFHHVLSRKDSTEKTMVIGRAANHSEKVFRHELSRCVVVCANCHRKLHAGLIKIPRGLSCQVTE